MQVMRLPHSPIVYEIHAAAWLSRLGTDLAHIPDAELERLSDLGINAVWLMGVWTRSPAARAVDAKNQDLQAHFKTVLADYTPDDAIGSAYAVKAYEVEPSFGGADGLAVFRSRLSNLGIGLILDFVPNHTAPDHAWTLSHPGIYIHKPDGVIALAKDPHFEPWPDVVQLNAFSAQYRQLAAETLASIAAQCDGVRCDMAMLLLNRIFTETWGELAGQQPADDFWPGIISSVKKLFPSFVFLAESYWDTETELIAQGFDYCYDKTLYDKLLTGDDTDIRAYLKATEQLRPHLAAFTENHDEQRAAAVMDPERNKYALAVILSLSGLRLIHDGQLEGYEIKIPVQLRRGPAEAARPQLQSALMATYLQAKTAAS